MEKSKHTPGPWKIRTGAAHETNVYTAYTQDWRITPRLVASIPHCGSEQFENTLPSSEDEANARLIATAPRMVMGLIALWLDLTSKQTVDSIRTGPHVTLVAGLLQEALGDDWREIALAEAADERKN